mmetsp:Transcript_5817/g.16081  ORF Transcript_5817/g.16081 Transcript_5817/m.16081 type:complete len:435 (-) Transcript_5817:247-1551(-)
MQPSLRWQVPQQLQGPDQQLQGWPGRAQRGGESVDDQLQQLFVLYAQRPECFQQVGQGLQLQPPRAVASAPQGVQSLVLQALGHAPLEVCRQLRGHVQDRDVIRCGHPVQLPQGRAQQGLQRWCIQVADLVQCHQHIHSVPTIHRGRQAHRTLAQFNIKRRVARTAARKTPKGPGQLPRRNLVHEILEPSRHRREEPGGGVGHRREDVERHSDFVRAHGVHLRLQAACQLRQEVGIRGASLAEGLSQAAKVAGVEVEHEGPRGRHQQVAKVLNIVGLCHGHAELHHRSGRAQVDVLLQVLPGLLNQRAVHHPQRHEARGCSSHVLNPHRALCARNVLCQPPDQRLVGDAQSHQGRDEGCDTPGIQLECALLQYGQHLLAQVPRDAHAGDFGTLRDTLEEQANLFRAHLDQPMPRSSEKGLEHMRERDAHQRTTS